MKTKALLTTALIAATLTTAQLARADVLAFAVYPSGAPYLKKDLNISVLDAEGNLKQEKRGAHRLWLSINKGTVQFIRDGEVVGSGRFQATDGKFSVKVKQ